MAIIILMVIVLLFSIVVTAIYINYSIKNEIIDIPNDRSSHTHPTPRGGGISISLSIIIGAIITYYLGFLSIFEFAAIFGSILIIAIVGWFDDHNDISFYWRIIFYSVASIWCMFWVGSLDSIKIGSIILPMSLPVGSVVTFLGLVWFTNLYNFMDGTDGLAAIQAICAALFSGILLLYTKHDGLALISFIILSSCVGFLYWNFPPAKIFMGDIGSCVLGFTFGLLAVMSDLSGAIPVSVWCILLSVFICDSTFTLLKRILDGDKWYSAHRSHAYQRLAQMGMSHKKLALMIFLTNILVIWPIAYLAYMMPRYSVYISIGIVCLMFILWKLIQIRYHSYEYENSGES
jgi:Fuc2NAc and GlcNAc transferase